MVQAAVSGTGPSRGALHLAQARLLLDDERRLALARALVDAKLRNQRALLRRLNQRRKDEACTRALERMNRFIRQLPAAPAVDALMGLEGAAAAVYWPAWARLIRHGWRFNARRRRPPPDPVNMLLSWMGSLLHRDLDCLVRRAGLHPGFAALHAASDDGDSCASDLIEPMRPPLVDGFVIYALNNRVVSPAHFALDDDGTSRIFPEGRDRVIRAFEGWLDRPVRSPLTGRRTVWRGILEEQVEGLRRLCRGEGELRPYVMDY
jgi:CRISPR-associated protein Cas1